MLFRWRHVLQYFIWVKEMDTSALLHSRGFYCCCCGCWKATNTLWMYVYLIHWGSLSRSTQQLHLNGHKNSATHSFGVCRTKEFGVGKWPFKSGGYETVTTSHRVFGCGSLLSILLLLLLLLNCWWNVAKYACIEFMAFLLCLCTALPCQWWNKSPLLYMSLSINEGFY